MSRDTSWEDVWAEYDARQAMHAAAPPLAETLADAGPEAALAPAAPSLARPGRLAMAGMLVLLGMLLGLPFGEAGAPAVASQEQAFQRHSMIVLGLSGEAEMAESPASAPPEATLLAEAVLLPLPPPAWVQPSAAPAAPQVAEPAAAVESRRPARPQRRLARPSRPAPQLATLAAPEQPWFEPAAGSGLRRNAARSRAAPGADRLMPAMPPAGGHSGEARTHDLPA